ncbi:uncharacterized protein RAG0_11988 [Rhynchosporium agropyri]|uniref:Uncharacterized protein n=1 Tax=Rhynchosporium agropyri TaxID=914238 RepID=A0A1E1L6P4_9HELO|nr:uncharacterized protein RAG0_11988 [Rhynchosporium agropyri]
MSVDTYLPYCRYLAQDRSYQASVSPGNIRPTDTGGGCHCWSLLQAPTGYNQPLLGSTVRRV